MYEQILADKSIRTCDQHPHPSLRFCTAGEEKALASALRALDIVSCGLQQALYRFTRRIVRLLLIDLE